MRVLRFLGWLLASLVVPGLGLWRAGHRGAASVVAAVALGAPTAVAFAVLWWPGVAGGLVIAAVVSGLTTLGAAFVGAVRASGEPREAWRSTIVFALMVLVARVPLQVWRERWADVVSVPSAAMRPSLEEGDQLIVRRGAAVTRGAVIVFRHERGVLYVKRVVGVGGDVVSWRDGALRINGTALVTGPCEAAAPDGCRTERFGEHTWRVFPGQGLFPGEWTVPPDTFFVLGDERDNSHDSRAFGPVAASQVVGVASDIHFSWPRVSRSGLAIDP